MPDPTQQALDPKAFSVTPENGTIQSVTYTNPYGVKVPTSKRLMDGAYWLDGTKTGDQSTFAGWYKPDSEGNLMIAPAAVSKNMAPTSFNGIPTAQRPTDGAVMLHPSFAPVPQPGFYHVDGSSITPAGDPGMLDNTLHFLGDTSKSLWKGVKDSRIVKGVGEELGLAGDTGQKAYQALTAGHPADAAQVVSDYNDQLATRPAGAVLGLAGGWPSKALTGASLLVDKATGNDVSAEVDRHNLQTGLSDYGDAAFTAAAGRLDQTRTAQLAQKAQQALDTELAKGDQADPDRVAQIQSVLEPLQARMKQADTQAGALAGQDQVLQDSGTNTGLGKTASGAADSAMDFLTMEGAAGLATKGFSSGSLLTRLAESKLPGSSAARAVTKTLADAKAPLLKRGVARLAQGTVMNASTAPADFTDRLAQGQTAGDAALGTLADQAKAAPTTAAFLSERLGKATKPFEAGTVKGMAGNFTLRTGALAGIATLTDFATSGFDPAKLDNLPHHIQGLLGMELMGALHAYAEAPTPAAKAKLAPDASAKVDARLADVDKAVQSGNLTAEEGSEIAKNLGKVKAQLADPAATDAPAEPAAPSAGAPKPAKSFLAQAVAANERLKGLSQVGKAAAAPEPGAEPAAAPPAPAEAPATASEPQVTEGPYDAARRQAEEPVAVEQRTGQDRRDTTADGQRLRDLRGKLKAGQLSPDESIELNHLQEADRAQDKLGNVSVPGSMSKEVFLEKHDAGDFKDHDFYFADLDDLKWFNKHFGPQEADQVIRTFRQTIADEINPLGGHSAGFGGDEVAVAVPKGQAGQEAIERAQAKLAGMRLEATDKITGEPITQDGLGFSFGKGASLEEAGSDLYNDKQRRRDTGKRKGVRDESPADGGGNAASVGSGRQAPDEPAAGPDSLGPQEPVDDGIADLAKQLGLDQTAFARNAVEVNTRHTAEDVNWPPRPRPEEPVSEAAPQPSPHQQAAQVLQNPEHMEVARKAGLPTLTARMTTDQARAVAAIPRGLDEHLAEQKTNLEDDAAKLDTQAAAPGLDASAAKALRLAAETKRLKAARLDHDTKERRGAIEQFALNQKLSTKQGGKRAIVSRDPLTTVHEGAGTLVQARQQGDTKTYHPLADEGMVQQAARRTKLSPEDSAKLKASPEGRQLTWTKNAEGVEVPRAHRPVAHLEMPETREGEAPLVHQHPFYDLQAHHARMQALADRLGLKSYNPPELEATGKPNSTHRALAFKEESKAPEPPRIKEEAAASDQPIRLSPSEKDAQAKVAETRAQRLAGVRDTKNIESLAQDGSRAVEQRGALALNLKGNDLLDRIKQVEGTRSQGESHVIDGLHARADQQEQEAKRHAGEGRTQAAAEWKARAADTRAKAEALESKLNEQALTPDELAAVVRLHDPESMKLEPEVPATPKNSKLSAIEQKLKGQAHDSRDIERPDDPANPRFDNLRTQISSANQEALGDAARMAKGGAAERERKLAAAGIEKLVRFGALDARDFNLPGERIREEREVKVGGESSPASTSTYLTSGKDTEHAPLVEDTRRALEASSLPESSKRAALSALGTADEQVGEHPVFDRRAAVASMKGTGGDVKEELARGIGSNPDLTASMGRVRAAITLEQAAKDLENHHADDPGSQRLAALLRAKADMAAHPGDWALFNTVKDQSGSYWKPILEPRGGGAGERQVLKPDEISALTNQNHPNHEEVLQQHTGSDSPFALQDAQASDTGQPRTGLDRLERPAVTPKPLTFIPEAGTWADEATGKEVPALLQKDAEAHGIQLQPGDKIAETVARGLKGVWEALDPAQHAAKILESLRSSTRPEDRAVAQAYDKTMGALKQGLGDTYKEVSRLLSFMDPRLIARLTIENEHPGEGTAAYDFGKNTLQLRSGFKDLLRLGNRTEAKQTFVHELMHWVSHYLDPETRLRVHELRSQAIDALADHYNKGGAVFREQAKLGPVLKLAKDRIMTSDTMVQAFSEEEVASIPAGYLKSLPEGSVADLPGGGKVIDFGQLIAKDPKHYRFLNDDEFFAEGAVDLLAKSMGIRREALDFGDEGAVAWHDTAHVLHGLAADAGSGTRAFRRLALDALMKAGPESAKAYQVELDKGLKGSDGLKLMLAMTDPLYRWKDGTIAPEVRQQIEAMMAGHTPMVANAVGNITDRLAAKTEDRQKAWAEGYFKGITKDASNLISGTLPRAAMKLGEKARGGADFLVSKFSPDALSSGTRIMANEARPFHARVLTVRQAAEVASRPVWEVLEKDNRTFASSAFQEKVRQAVYERVKGATKGDLNPVGGGARGLYHDRVVVDGKSVAVNFTEDGKLKAFQTPEQADALRYIESRGAQGGEHLSPETKAAADAFFPKMANIESHLRDLVESSVPEEQRDRVTSAWANDYLPHLYAGSDGTTSLDNRFTDQAPSYTTLSRLEKRVFPTYDEAREKAGLLPRMINPMDAYRTGVRQLSEIATLRASVKQLEDVGLAPFTQGPPEGDDKNWKKLPLPENQTTALHRLGFETKEGENRQVWIPNEFAPLFKALYGRGLAGGDVPILSPAYKLFMGLSSTLSSPKLSLSLFHPGTILDLSGVEAFKEAWQHYGRFKTQGMSTPDALKRAAVALGNQMRVANMWKQGTDLRQKFLANGHMEEGELLGADHLTDLEKVQIAAMQQGFHDAKLDPFAQSRQRDKFKAALANLHDSTAVAKLAATIQIPFRGAGSLMELLSHGTMEGFVSRMKSAHLGAAVEHLVGEEGFDPKAKGWAQDFLAKTSRIQEGGEYQTSFFDEFSRKIVRQNDNLFGMVNYKNMMANPYLRDAMQAWYLSFGWREGHTTTLFKALDNSANRVPGIGDTYRAFKRGAGGTGIHDSVRGETGMDTVASQVLANVTLSAILGAATVAFFPQSLNPSKHDGDTTDRYRQVFEDLLYPAFSDRWNSQGLHNHYSLGFGREFTEPFSHPGAWLLDHAKPNNPAFTAIKAFWSGHDEIGNEIGNPHNFLPESWAKGLEPMARTTMGRYALGMANEFMPITLTQGKRLVDTGASKKEIAATLLGFRRMPDRFAVGESDPIKAAFQAKNEKMQGIESKPKDMDEQVARLDKNMATVKALNEKDPSDLADRDKRNLFGTTAAMPGDEPLPLLHRTFRSADINARIAMLKASNDNQAKEVWPILLEDVDRRLQSVARSNPQRADKIRAQLQAIQAKHHLEGLESP